MNAWTRAWQRPTNFASLPRKKNVNNNNIINNYKPEQNVTRVEKKWRECYSETYWNISVPCFDL